MFENIGKDQKLENINAAIWHIADIHIHNSDSTNNYNKDVIFAIDGLIDKIKKAQIERNLIIIAGDVFEYKTRYDQYDTDCFNIIIEKLIEVAKVLIIVGNHDYNNNNNDHDIEKNKDLISPLMKYMNKDRVMLFRDSGIYNIQGWEEFNFHVLSPIDKKPILEDLSNKIKVAILHEPLRDCKAYGSNVIARYDTNDFDLFDLVMLGDMHQIQFLGKNKNIVYPGSLIQKNKSEGIVHGGVKWELDLNNKKFKTVRINLKLNRGYLIFEAENNKLLSIDDKYGIPDVVKKAVNIIIYMELRYKNCDNVENLKNELVNTYKFKSVKVINQNSIEVVKKIEKIEEAEEEKENTEAKKESEEKQEIQDDIIVLKELLDEIKSNHKNAIMELHQKYTETYHDKSTTCKKWKINNLYWSNLFCYGKENYIDFMQLNGMYSLVGNNKTGKSSIIDILLLALYNKCLRGSKKTLMNNTANTDYEVNCEFSVMENHEYQKYMICQKGNLTNQKHYFLKFNTTDDEWKNITTKDIKTTYENIKSMIGELSDFTNINIGLQGNTSIVNKKQDDQLDDFRKYFGLDKIKYIKKLVKSEISNLTRDVKNLTSENNGLDFKNINEQQIDDEISELVVKKNGIEEKIIKLNVMRDEYNIKLYPKNITLEEYNKISKLLILNNESNVKDCSQNDLQSLYVKLKTYSVPYKFSKSKNIIDELNLRKDRFENMKINSNMTTNILELKNNLNYYNNEILELYKKFINYDSNSKIKKEKIIDKIKTFDGIKIEISEDEIQKKINEYKTQYIKKEITKLDELLSKTEINEKINMNLKELENLEKNDGQKYIDVLDGTKILEELGFSNFKFSNNCICCKSNILNYDRIISILSDKKKYENIKKLKHENERLRDMNIYIDNLELTKKINELNIMLEKIKTIRILSEIEHNEKIGEKVKFYTECKQESEYHIEYFQLRDEINVLSDEIAYNKIIQTEIDDLQIRLLQKEYLEKIMIYQNNKKNNNEIKILDENLKKKNIKIKILNEKLSILEKKKYDFNIYIERIKKIDGKDKDKKIYQSYNECLSSKTGIQKKILEKSCMFIKQKINEILYGITDFIISPEFDKKKFNFMILDGSSTGKNENKRIPATQGSGFQQFVIDLCFRLVMASDHPYLPNCLIIDEGFGCMDKQHLDNIKEFLIKLKMQNKFDWMILISHIDDLKNITENNIIIKRDGDMSKLVVGKIGIYPKFEKLENVNIVEISAINVEKIEEIYVIKDGKIYCNLCKNNIRGDKDTHNKTKTHMSKMKKI